MHKKPRAQPLNPFPKKRIDILWYCYMGIPYHQFMFLSESKSRDGFVFESLAEIGILTKELVDNFDEIYKNHLCDKVLLPIKSSREILEKDIYQGNNPSDITYSKDGVIYVVSVKYKDSYGDTDLNRLTTACKNKGCEYKLSLIVKKKNTYLKHNFHHDSMPDKLLIEKVNEDGLLKNEKEVKIAYQSLQAKMKLMKFKDKDEIYDWLDKKYLNNSKKSLKLWFHQFLGYERVMHNINMGEKSILLAHKPRSGKTITLLRICKELLKTNKIILLMTSVMPEDILGSFISTINEYTDFDDIKYKTQDEFLKIKTDFRGIIFCSVQYLKADSHGLKGNKLKELNPKADIFDECHFHSSNYNTYQKIINVTDEKPIIIFASGTSDKTCSYYNIKPACISKWDMIDENMMKHINKPENMIFMNERHSHNRPDIFRDIYNEKKNILNCNYENCPLQVLLQPEISMKIIEEINNHADVKKGYNCSSLLALKSTRKSKKSDSKYIKKFQLDESNHGRRFLKKFFESIISDDPNNENTAMRMIENIHSEYDMEPSNEDNPRLFPTFLPYGPNIGPIDMIEETLYAFIKKNKLWSDYHICYSSSKKTSSESNKSYYDFIEENMKITRSENKLGCILLLGNQGKVGITYKDCDVTISLDNGTNIDDQKQTYYRSMTERSGKTIGINVDFNIQRVLQYHYQMITNYKKITNKHQSISETMQTLYKENLYIFNPQEMNMGNCKKSIINYYDKVESSIKTILEIESITNNIQCKDNLHDYINDVVKDTFEINNKLQGTQQDCNSGESTKLKVDPIEDDGENNKKEEKNSSDIADEKELCDILIDVNKTKAVYEYITKLSCLLLRIKRKDPKNIDKDSLMLITMLKEDDKRMDIIYNQLEKIFMIDQKYLKIIYDKYINDMDNETNHQILDQIFEFYSDTSPKLLREIIAKHFIPSKTQRDKNAEIPTSEKCVNEMLDKMPSSFWNKKRYIFEPCCGKGNFVLAIFEKMFNGLTTITDEIERIRVILEDCLYFTDIDEVNVFITKELLICHAISKLGEEAWRDWDKIIEIYNYEIRGYVCNTLEYDPQIKFDAIIGNPPYQERNKNGKSKHGKSNLWTKFIDYSFDLLKKNGYLLFITPTSWMGGTVTCWDKMIKHQSRQACRQNCYLYRTHPHLDLHPQSISTPRVHRGV